MEKKKLIAKFGPSDENDGASVNVAQSDSFLYSQSRLIKVDRGKKMGCYVCKMGKTGLCSKP